MEVVELLWFPDGFAAEVNLPGHSIWIPERKREETRTQINSWTCLSGKRSKDIVQVKESQQKVGLPTSHGRSHCCQCKGAASNGSLEMKEKWASSETVAQQWMFMLYFVFMLDKKQLSDSTKLTPDGFHMMTGLLQQSLWVHCTKKKKETMKYWRCYWMSYNHEVARWDA